jgi:hypothetical protein
LFSDTTFGRDGTMNRGLNTLSGAALWFAGAAALWFAGAAALLLLGCAGGGVPERRQAGAQPPTEETSEFGCVTPAHFCPNAFDIDLRQKACTCQGEPGRFKYRLRGR